MSYQYDHRQLADEMEIFFFDEEIGAGLPVWLPHGVVIRDQLEQWIKSLEHQAGYQRVVSPHIGRAELYEKSGHLVNFNENMFPPILWPGEKNSYYLKPMNCPHHHKVFQSSPRSYRQLPLKVAEYGQVYRFEPSGSLRGLSRARSLSQNDAHIYVEPQKALSEILKVLDLHEHCYKRLELKDYRYRLSLGDRNRQQDFQGPSVLWDHSEEILREALKKRDLPFFEAKGEAAFYGPKIDVQMKMFGDKEESIASVQLDFISAEKFQLHYVNSSGESVQPWVIHRAPLGSHERFVALLLEYFDGQLPAWLAPIQVLMIPLSENEYEHCYRLKELFLSAGIRSEIDLNQGSLSKRILFSHRLRPFSKLVIGSKEIASGAYNLQVRKENRALDLNHLVQFLKRECEMP